MKKEKLIGGWRLKSWTAIAPDNKEQFPMGEKASGLIIYTADGYMSAIISNPDKPLTENSISYNSMINGDGAFLSYSGRYTVNDNKASHFVELSSVPQWVGTVQERHLSLTENTLTIHSETVHDGYTFKHTLIWER